MFSLEICGTSPVGEPFSAFQHLWAYSILGSFLLLFNDLNTFHEGSEINQLHDFPFCLCSSGLSS